MYGRPGITVVVPAHDEAAVIGHCLASLAVQDHRGAVQVIVSANGCGDDTAAIAGGFRPALRRRGYELVVLRDPAPSKPGALNAADALARYGNRLYLDADVELSPGSLSSISRAFGSGIPFCAPSIRPHASTYSGAVYGRVWSRLPYVADDVVGAGAYAVSAAGRRRWNEFPEIVADDKYARLHFDRDERVVLEDCSFAMYLPEGVGELVRVRSRWIRANRQLRRRFPELARLEPDRYAGLGAFVGSSRDLWRDLPAFAIVYGCAEVRSFLPAGVRWERATRARDRRYSPREVGRPSSDPCSTGSTSSTPTASSANASARATSAWV